MRQNRFMTLLPAHTYTLYNNGTVQTTYCTNICGGINYERSVTISRHTK